MNTLKINNFLISMTTDCTADDMKKVTDFLEWKRSPLSTLYCITTSGKDSWKKLEEINKILKSKEISFQNYWASRMQSPNLAGTYDLMDHLTSFQFYDHGILLISDVSLEDFFKPIQVWLEFVDKDFPDDKENYEYLIDFVLAYRHTPNLVIYDARSLSII